MFGAIVDKSISNDKSENWCNAFLNLFIPIPSEIGYKNEL